MNDLILGITFAAAIGCGIIGGAFFAFSSFIMRSLARIPAPEGIRAMQSINIVVINPWFMIPFFGTALLSIALAVLAVMGLAEPEAIYLLAGSVLYLLGVIVVTIAGNVPLNNELAAANAESADGHAIWERYLSRWTMLNTLRTVAALAASACFIGAMLVA